MQQYYELTALLEKWTYLGRKELTNGVILIGHVPHIAPEAWLHTIYPGLNKNQIETLEQNLLIKFTTDFRSFLSYNNGINIFADSLSIFGLRTSYERQGDKSRQPYDIISLNKERPKGCSKYFLHIGSYSWDGSKVYIDCEDEQNQKVYRCERRGLTILQEWADICSWLVGETTRLQLLFDDRGKKENPKMPTV